jgi:hypothetical protein
MKKKCSLIILAVFLYSKGNSQFLVFPQEKQRSDYYHTLLPQNSINTFQYLVIRDNNNFTPFREPHQILTYDLNGQFIDSVNLPRGFVPIGIPIKLNGFYYWSTLYRDTTTSNPNIQDAFLLKFDAMFNCITKKRISNVINTSELPSNPIEINHKIFVSVQNFLNSDFKLYKLDTLLNKLDSVFQPNLHVISELQKTHDKKIIIAGNGFPSPSLPGPQKTIIDTMLHISDVFLLDSLTYVTAGGTVVTGCSSQISIDVDFFKIIPITRVKNYIIGHTDVVYNANCNYRKNIIHAIIDNTNKIINTTLINDTTRGVRYADNTNSVIYNGQHIFTVGSEGYAGLLVQTNNTSILVTKSDTLGNLIWKKRFGDDMFYRPVSMIQTLDSGFLVSGVRYDYLNTPFSGSAQGFILRLSKNGELISTGIKEQKSANYISIRCFPNPTIDNIFIDVPLTDQYELYVYDVYGKLLYQNKQFKNLSSLSTAQLSSGIYLINVKSKTIDIIQKFVKE